MLYFIHNRFILPKIFYIYFSKNVSTFSQCHNHDADLDEFLKYCCLHVNKKLVGIRTYTIKIYIPTI